MRLTVLGSGTAVPRADRGAAGYLVEVGGEKLLLDCGAGTTQRLLAAGTDPRDLDVVALSHEHIDHFGEIGHLLFSARLPRHGRTKPLTLAGSGALLQKIRGLQDLFPGWLEPRGYNLHLHDLDSGEREGASMRVAGYPVDHIPSARALRVQGGGAVLAYSGDTDVCAGVIEAAQGADLLLVECSFPDGEKQPGHLTPSEAAEIGVRAGARGLLLTHFYPECDPDEAVRVAGRRFQGPVQAAADGLVLSVGATA